MTSPYAQVGARLVERGYCALPVVPGTKVPGAWIGGAWRPMLDWTQRYRDRLPSDIEIASWESRPDAGVCIVLGRGVVSVDVDVDEAVELVSRVLPYTPVRKRGKKGETLFFRAEGQIPLRAFNRIVDGRRERLVDVLAEGRQTISVPSIHPDTGQPYTWTGESALEDIDPSELPLIDASALDAIAAALEPLGYRAEADRAPIDATASSDADSPFRRLNDHALANLDAWVPHLPLARLKRKANGYEAVADWRASNTGRPIAKRKLNLSITPHGITDFGDGPKGHTAIDLVILTGRAPDAERAFGLLADLTGWGAVVPVDFPRARETIVVDGTVADAETGEIVEELPGGEPGDHPAKDDGAGPVASLRATGPESAGSASDDFADAFLRMPGLVSDIARWVLSVARRPQKRFAVATALAVIGTVASRQLVTPTFANLNTYMLLITRSGNGKDAPMKTSKALLAAAKLSDLIGPEGFGSDVGIFDHANRAPVSLTVIDEFGDHLAATSGQRASPYVLKISSAIRTMYDGGLIKTSHALTRNSVTLYNPCLSLLCASTPGQFFDAVGQKQALDGFLNRFLLINAPGAAQRAKGGDVEDVPINIAERLAAVANRPGGTDFARFRAGPCAIGSPGKAEVVPWGSGAEDHWIAYEDAILRKMEISPTFESFAPRCALNALKIATILAISENASEPVVTAAHVDLGITMIEASLKDMIGGFEAHMPQTAEAELADKVVARIAAAGTITHNKLFRSVQRAFKKSSDFEEMLKMLIDAGRIAVDAKRPPAGGPLMRTYRIDQSAIM